MSIASKVSELAAKLADHARRISDLETSPRLPYSSLSDGETIDLIGGEGNVVSTFGKNPDGTYATVPFDGPAPRRLIEPSVDDEGVVDSGEVDVVSDAPGTITVKFSPKKVLPADFAGVDFFYTSGEDRVLLGSVTSLTGGAKTVAVKPGSYEVVAQMRSIPGKTTLLDHKFSVTVAAPVDVKDFDNAKARLTTAQSQIDALLAAPPSAGVSVSATPPSDPKNGDMWLHPVTDDMGNTVHVLQVYQAGAWVTVEDQDAKQIAAGAKASADAATQTANLAKTTAEQAATGAVDVTRLAADSNSTVKESVVGKLWDVIRAKLVAAKQIITEDMLATGSVTASKITASEELSAKAAKFLRITADQIKAGTLNAKVKIGSEGSITVGNNDIVLDSEKISVGHKTWNQLPSGYWDKTNQIILDPRSGMDIYIPGNEDPKNLIEPLDPSKPIDPRLPGPRGISFIAVDQDQTKHPQAAINAYSGHEESILGFEVNNMGDTDGNSLTALEIGRNRIVACHYPDTTNGPYPELPVLYATAAFPVRGEDIARALKQVAITHGTDPKVTRPDAETVTWIGTVEPVNLASTDIWIEPQAS
ncbi:hypothetical protein [Varibaculum cambriense]|uniref:Minor tail protein n=1 Tax=Varibaculum cambriense TaxID=184870 RepID=A0ABX4UNK7_9ACTO|nr:hypothetical protein [Varibaculum cambriense]PMB89285.1 hypothetical protein CJ240_05830 [Varibaculum cambriense]